MTTIQPTSYRVRFAVPAGDTRTEMRQWLSAHPEGTALIEKGDCILAWVNEGDLFDGLPAALAHAAVPTELWALCYLHDWEPPKEGQEHRWEPWKNVFPQVHAFYHDWKTAEAVRRDMTNPHKYWVVRARAESEARLTKVNAAAPAAPAPVQAVAAYEAVEEKTESDNFHTSIYEADYKGLLVARCNQNGNHPQQVVAILQGLNGNAAPPAAEPVAVQVKALEWGDGPAGTETLVAEAPWGEYTIWEIGGSGYWTAGHMPGKYAGPNGIESAKAAAQADYERRIRSALTHTDASAEIAWAAADVLAERRRQVDEEGWTPEHDDAYVHRDLARAAACYATGHVDRWPWSLKWWKPSNYRRSLVKAGALIIAEIERLDRAALQAKGGE